MADLALFDRALVVLKALPTRLTALAVALPLAYAQLAPHLPSSVQGDAGSVLVTLVAWLGSAVVIIRNVTPVVDELRGLLPADD